MILLRQSAPIFAVLMLAGCASDMSAYPSLAPRKVEKSAEPAPAEPAPPMPPAGSTDVSAIVTAAKAADAAFNAEVAKARPTIEKGRNAAQGGDAWVAAQQAYSGVESARGGVGSALADLDRLHQEAVATGDPARLAGVEAAIAEVQAIDGAEQATLASLQP
ncbi:hypothetical protein [Sphingomonas montanisoli]|uniref:DUF4398 domain-containing protein n=1 Tax=Sphingomonas montanisoli TaxID=2606412 RepID=A0A5D9C2L5_9SPHN|nr:hypothetical protein [Sphingomonas montanisoli]TZG24145.1 hypothetical protein FYJ91_20140 [Sphingomonas montanisoli]